MSVYFDPQSVTTKVILPDTAVQPPTAQAQPTAPKVGPEPANPGTATAFPPSSPSPAPAALTGTGGPIQALATRIADISDRLLAVSNYLSDIAAVLDKGPQGYYAEVVKGRGTAPGFGQADANWVLPLLVSSLARASTSTGSAKGQESSQNSNLNAGFDIANSGLTANRGANHGTQPAAPDDDALLPLILGLISKGSG